MRDNAGGSGLATNTVAGQTISAEGVTASVTNSGTCTDNAGNSADSASFGPIKLDKTRPTATASRRQPAGGRGVYGWDLDEPERQGRLRLPGRRQRRRDRHGSGRHGDHRRRRPVRHELQEHVRTTPVTPRFRRRSRISISTRPRPPRAPPSTVGPITTAGTTPRSRTRPRARTPPPGSRAAPRAPTRVPTGAD